MDGLFRILVALLGVLSGSRNNCISSSVLEVTVRHGDNITLYCDCKTALGVLIVWYRNCSHENQPALVLEWNTIYREKNRFPRFEIEKNSSSDSYDLVIMNVTNNDEGLYYCGTEEKTVEKKEVIAAKDIHRYGNTSTRLTVNSSGPDPDFRLNPEDCSLCWKLLFFLCPAVCVLSALVSSVLVHLLCHKTGKTSQIDEKGHNIIKETQGEDVCYAALEIRSVSQRATKSRTVQSSDFSMYSTVNTLQE